MPGMEQEINICELMSISNHNFSSHWWTQYKVVQIPNMPQPNLANLLIF